MPIAAAATSHPICQPIARTNLASKQSLFTVYRGLTAVKETTVQGKAWSKMNRQQKLAQRHNEVLMQLTEPAEQLMGGLKANEPIFASKAWPAEQSGSFWLLDGRSPSGVATLAAFVANAAAAVADRMVQTVTCLPTARWFESLSLASCELAPRRQTP